MTTQKTPVKRPRPAKARQRSRLDQAIIDMSEHKRKVEVLKAEIAQAEAIALEAMNETGEKTHTITYSGETISATVVAGERVSLDEPALKKKVGAGVWGKITSAVLDKSKLEAQIKLGAVSEVDVAAASTITPSKPYVKITRK